jgi:hypothetical protein
MAASVSAEKMTATYRALVLLQDTISGAATRTEMIDDCLTEGAFTEGDAYTRLLHVMRDVRDAVRAPARSLAKSRSPPCRWRGRA